MADPTAVTKIIDPDALTALVRHFSESTGTRVILDYSPGAVPRTAEDGTVYIPGLLPRPAVDQVLINAVHEGNHSRRDQRGMKILADLCRQTQRSDIRVLPVLHNAVLDARIDLTVMKEYPGLVQGYQDAAASHDARPLDDVTSLCVALLIEAAGHTDAAPDLIKRARAKMGDACFNEAVALLRACPSKTKGPLILEAFRLRRIFIKAFGKPPDAPPATPGQTAAKPEPASGGESGAGEGGAGEESDDQDESDGTGEGSAGEGEESDGEAEAGSADEDRAPSSPDEGMDRAAEAEYASGSKAPSRKLHEALMQDSATDAAIVGAFAGGIGRGHVSVAATVPENLLSADAGRVAADAFVRQAARAFVETVDYEDDPDPAAATRVDLSDPTVLFTAPHRVLKADASLVEAGAAVEILVDCSGSTGGGFPLSPTSGAFDYTPLRPIWEAALDGAAILAQAVGDVGGDRVYLSVAVFSTGNAQVVDYDSSDQIAHRGRVPAVIKALEGLDNGEYAGPVPEAVSRAHAFGGGTEAADALRAALRRLEDRRERVKAIVMFTDGEVGYDAYEVTTSGAWPGNVRLAIITLRAARSRRAHPEFAARIPPAWRYVANCDPDVPITLARALRAAVAEG